MSAEFFWVSLLIALVAAPFLGMRKQWKTAGVLLGMASIVPASDFYAQLTDPTISQSDRQMGQLSLMIAAVSLLMSVGGFAAGWFIRSSQLRSGKQPAGESFR